jgi:hypothetical protein
MDYKSLSVLVAVFLAVGFVDNSSALASKVCLVFIVSVWFIDVAEILFKRRKI